MEAELNEALLKKKLRFQKQFPIGPFFVDLAYPEVMLAVEYDGAEFHNPEKDKERDLYIGKLGWTVLRVRKLAHLFFLSRNGDDICGGPMDLIAEWIDEIFERRRYKYNYERRFENEEAEFARLDLGAFYQKFVKLGKEDFPPTPKL
jgi:hypothetical protein